MWFGACFLCILFVWLMIYETKGLSLEQVDQLYNEVSDARESAKWKPTLTWEGKKENLASEHREATVQDDSVAAKTEVS